MRRLLLTRWFAAAIGLVALPSLTYGQTSPSPYTTGYRYDPVGHVIGVISPAPGGTGSPNYLATRNTYDADGRLVEVEHGHLSSWQSDSIAPAAWTGFVIDVAMAMTYDQLGRKLTEETVGSDGNPASLIQYSYDAVGRLQCTAVRMNPTAFTSLPASACTLGTQGNNGPDRITYNTYDAAGQLLKVTKAYGTPDQADDATYSYSPDGMRTSVTDADGNLATLSYDGYDRLAQWTFPSPTTKGQVNASDYESYGYDANGNRTSLRRRDGRTLTFAYDALNRVTMKTVPTGCAPIQVGACPAAAATRNVYFGYDLQGHVLYARYDSASGDGVTNVYDGFGQITSTTTAMLGTSRTVNHQFDADGNLTQISDPGGSWGYGYDGLDRLTSLVETPANPVTLSTWTYNPQGLVASVVERYGSSTSWSYDGVDRLTGQTDSFGGGTGSVTHTLGYNPASQITSLTRDNDAFAYTGSVNVNRPYTVNGLNQYSAAGPASFTYDADGNLVSDGTTSYGYDAENRLITSSAGAGLTYDPLGRLFQVTMGGTTTQFLYDGDKLVMEYDGSGNVTSKYVHGPGEDTPLIWYPAGGGWLRWLHHDHQGSIIGYATGTNGALGGIDAYDEYGIPGPGNTGRFQYTGQAWIPELGMYYYKARIYSPTLGRFMQVDPIGYKDQINLYEYVGDDPVDRVDPSGNNESAALSVLEYTGEADVAEEAGGSNLNPLVDAAQAATTLGGIAIAGYELLQPANDIDQSPTLTANRNPPVPGTGRRAGDVKPAWVVPGKKGPPSIGPRGKKSDGPQDAARGGRFGGVQGSKTQGKKFRGSKGGDGRQDPGGHAGGPGHDHPPTSDGDNKGGHWWWPF